MKIPVSVIIPVYNEEKNIQGCLESVAWAEEIIVVDGGSSDRTVEIARKFTHRILQTDNAPAETQRLKGLGEASAPWFFLLDADERVSEPLAGQIEKAVKEASDDVSAFLVLRVNLYRERPVHLHHPDYQMRLFRRGMEKGLPDKIHRIPRMPGRVGRLAQPLYHYFFSGVTPYLTKLYRYTAIEASYWHESGRKIRGAGWVYYLLVRPVGRFFQYFFLKGGYRDGLFGFFFSVSSAYYDWLVAIRVLLEDYDPDRSDSPKR